MTQATAEVLKQGLLGALLVVMGAVVYFLYRSLEAERKASVAEVKDHATELAATHAHHLADLSAQQTARLEDQRASQQQLLELTRTSVTAVNGSVNASLATKEALAEVRVTIKEHNAALLDALERTSGR